jgi:dethiobiotin synthetase
MQVKRAIFVTATGTGVGKTFVSLRLLELFASRGYCVGAVKPLETGVQDIPRDAQKLLNLCKRHNDAFATLEPADLCAYTFPLPAAPFCADSAGVIEEDAIFAKIEEMASRCEILLIEGAGGPLVPITKTLYMIDIPKVTGAHTLLVTPSRLGCINETLCAMEVLESRAVEYEWCINIHEDADSFDRVSRPFFDSHFPGWIESGGGLERFADKILESS